MDQLGLIEISVTKNGNTYRLQLPLGAPLGELFDASHELLTNVVTLINQELQKFKPAPAPEPVAPVTEPVKEQ